ncbi:MAG: peroxiredoxin family protein [Polyangiaceae bacterium]
MTSTVLRSPQSSPSALVSPSPLFLFAMRAAAGLAMVVVGLSGCAEEGGGGGGGGKGADDPSSEKSSDKGLIGNPAPDFTVARAAGSKGKISLANLAGNVVVIDFWGTFCEPCKKSFPKLQDLSAKYGESGLRVVAISEDEPEDKDKIPEFVKTYGAKFAIGWDEDKSVARHYKPETMPSSFLVDRKGIVRFAHVGYHDGEEVSIEKELKGLLDEK